MYKNFEALRHDNLFVGALYEVGLELGLLLVF